MQFAINYSAAAASLVREGLISLDRFKCPMWPRLVEEAQETGAVYIHFPFRVGAGIGDALDMEINQRVEWEQVEAWLLQSDTPLVNLHLTPTPRDFPDIPRDSSDPTHVARVTEALVRDVGAVVARLGPELVVVEGDYDSVSASLRAGYQPEVIRRVVEETGCGLLLDLSHARLAAESLGMDPYHYLDALPLDRIREIHLTGIQPFDAGWVARMRAAGVAEEQFQPWAGRRMDHLPLTDEDWHFAAWATDQVRADAWGTPWVIAFEYGGVGTMWEALTDEEVLAEQGPRLYELVKKGW